ncbi:MAG: RND family transporter [Dehalococcoidia bacterium]
MQDNETLPHKIAILLERRSGWFILAILAITILLAIPMVTMAPNEMASDNPGGTVYDLETLVNTTLPSRVHGAFFLVESREGNVLTQEPLWELYQNTERLRQADREGKLNPPGLPRQPYLFSGFDVDRQQPIVGIYTLADAIQEVLIRDPGLNTNLEQATDEQVKVAIHEVLNDPRTEGMQEFLSQKKAMERGTILGREIDSWTASALTFNVVADNEKLGGGSLRIGATSDPITENKEHFNRKTQAILRGEQNKYRLWGVAIDAGLEIADEVATAVPFIAATFIMVLVVVGISLRSARVVLLTGLGLASMIIWLKGLSNLVGLKSSTTLDFIVPIAMISLGADFAIHTVNRYREERRVGLDAQGAFRLGMAGVLTALVLAMATDAIAFLANTSADIETVIGFGIGAGLAILAAFVILGLTVPVVLMRLDARRTKAATVRANPGSSPQDPGTQTGRSPLAGLVVGLARWHLVILPLAALVTGVAAYFAFQLEATFDVKDFFKSDSDFAVSLDKLDEHVGESGGEPAIIYIQGDLTDPAALAAVQDFLNHVANNPYVGKNDEGEASLGARPLFAVLEQVMHSDYARAQIEQVSGVSLSPDGALNEFHYGGGVYRWPRSREQLKAIYDYIAVNGVPLSPTQKAYDALEVSETLFHNPTGAREDATTIVVGIPATRQQTNVIGSRDTLTENLRVLQAAPSITRVGLTGSPYTRQAGLDATTNGLQRAFLIALVACLLVAVLAMRSLRLGVVTIIPIGLVVAWLYAFMYVFGFGLNFITATIAAISIGIGIDYSIHFTQRFREELAKVGDNLQALYQAAQGTGVALLASAATSILGFTIMAFAPMPMFSSYGILTAMMIFFAAAASLLVLPSLLMLVTPGAKALGPNAASQKRSSRSKTTV